MEIQKKWFLYINDHHEGPFSLEEVRQKLISRQITHESYVWCEGMTDWQMLSQVHELSQLEASLVSEISPQPTAPSVKKTADKIPTAKTPTPKSPVKKNLPKMTAIAISTLVILLVLTLGGLAALSRSGSDSVHAKLHPTFVSMVDRFPFLSGAFRLVPNFADLKPEDQRDLEQTQMGFPENGVKLAIALSQNDPNRPFFYVGTNLPHRTKLDLYLVGNNETLLNRLSYSTQVSFFVNHGMGKSEVLLAEGGQPLPKGEYQVYVTESAEQDETNSHLIADYPTNKAVFKTPPPVPDGTRFSWVENGMKPTSPV